MKNEANDAKESVDWAALEAAVKVGRAHGAAEAGAAIDQGLARKPWVRGLLGMKFDTEAEEKAAEDGAQDAWDQAWDALEDEAEERDFLVLGDFEALEPGDPDDDYRVARLAEVFWPGENGRAEIHHCPRKRVLADDRVYHFAVLHDRELALSAVEGRDVRDPAARREIIESLELAFAI